MMPHYSMDKPHGVKFSDKSRKKWERVAALLNLDDWCHALAVAEQLTLMFAEEYVKGNGEILCVPSGFAKLYKDNPKFFEALCEEGVVEWLEHFVITNSSL
jgi:hypothetical protein